MSEAVDIQKLVRPMRGKSRSILAAGADGHCYIVKPSGDEQRNRGLVNECFGHTILRALGITTPEIRIIRVSDCASQSLTAHIPGSHSLPIGLHFGSRTPKDPSQQTIYDFWPRSLSHRIRNRDQLAEIFVADVWLSNAGCRQQVFVFENGENGRAADAYCIDNDEILSGAQWQIEDPYMAVRWQDSLSLRGLPVSDLCSCAIENIEQLDVGSITSKTLSLCPREWIPPHEEQQLRLCLDELDRKRSRLGVELESVLRAIENRNANR
jgi:hypothetical protein